jgi:hypothetical protein
MSAGDETGGDWVCFPQKTITQDIVDDGKKRCAWLWAFCCEKPRDHSERDFCRRFATSQLKRLNGGMNTPISKFSNEDNMERIIGLFPVGILSHDAVMPFTYTCFKVTPSCRHASRQSTETNESHHEAKKAQDVHGLKVRD